MTKGVLVIKKDVTQSLNNVFHPCCRFKLFTDFIGLVVNWYELCKSFGYSTTNEVISSDTMLRGYDNVHFFELEVGFNDSCNDSLF